jgi:hypothetical protein
MTSSLISAENPTCGLNPTQTLMLVKTLQYARESAAKLGADHRDLHSSVSKVARQGAPS